MPLQIAERSGISPRFRAFESDSLVAHVDELIQFIDVAIAVTIQIDVGRDVERHHEGLGLGDNLLGGRAVRDRNRRGDFGRKVSLVPVEIVVAIDQDLGVEAGNDFRQTILREIGESEVFRALQVDSIITEGRTRIEDDDPGFAAHLEEGIEVDEPGGAVRLHLRHETLKILIADFCLGVVLRFLRCGLPTRHSPRQTLVAPFSIELSHQLGICGSRFPARPPNILVAHGSLGGGRLLGGCGVHDQKRQRCRRDQ